VASNVIYILADDLGYGDLGCYGQQRIKTPHIDTLASEGMRFTQHYAGQAIGAPSRCALLTGRHTGHCTVREENVGLMEPNEITIGTLVKNAGYATAYIGKWGVGDRPEPDDPMQHGFDEFFGYVDMWHAHNHYPEWLWKNGVKVKLKNKVHHPPAHERRAQGELTGIAYEKRQYACDLFTEEALRFIESHKEQPFFLFLSYTIPHANSEATQDFRDWLSREGNSPADGGIYDVDIKPGPNPLEVPDIGIYKNKDWPESEKAKAAMITRLDGDVGRLLTALKALGIDQETVVFFSSDNGPHQEGVDPEFFDSNGPLRGSKGDLHEGGIRVPLIVRWPGKIPASEECDHVSASWDILPTLADIVGTEPPAPTDGLSVMPALLGRAQPRHEYLYWEYHDRFSVQAVRMGNWKGIRQGSAGPLELYNLKYDVGEKHNVSKRHPHIVARIKGIMARSRTHVDKWPLRDDIPSED
jgi:arylsulfatase A-like enzyme